MTLVLGLVLVIAVVLLLAGAVMALDHRDVAGRRLVEFVVAQHARNLDAQREAKMLVREFADHLVAASARESADLRLVVEALIGDRDRLLTASLAASPNPMAARVLGMVDQVNGKLEGITGERREFLNEMKARMPNEFTDDNGQPIVPVGLGSG